MKRKDGATNPGRNGKKTATARAALPPIYYRMHALLHTIRAIEEQEDQLCTLLHEVENTGGVSDALRDELLTFLERIPSSTYQDELHAVFHALEHGA